MKTSFLYWIKISRPRFWLYLAGTYLVGVSIAARSVEELYRLDIWLYFLLFLVPANFLLYGVNDYYDIETDALNAKKSKKEVRVEKESQRKIIRFMLFIVIFLFLGVVLFQENQHLQITLLSFIFLSLFYSAPPIRFKARPFFDSMSNILYILPGVFGYMYLSGLDPSFIDILMFGLWASAMHLFSAIPDIEPDTRADVRTSAVLLGREYALMVCSFLWLLFVALVWYRHSAIFLYTFFLIMYPIIPALILRKKEIRIDTVYWYFPYVNSVVGFLIVIFFMFWY